MHSCPVPRLVREQRLDGLDDPQPHPLPVEVAVIEHCVGIHGGVDRGLRAVLLHEQVGRAVDVEV